MMRNPLAIFLLCVGVFAAVLIGLLLFTSGGFQFGGPGLSAEERFIQVAERLAVEAHATSTQSGLADIEKELERHYRSLGNPSDAAIEAAGNCHLAINARKSELLEERPE